MMKEGILRSLTQYSGFLHLACGLSVGLSGLAAGYAIGVVGDMVSTCFMLPEDT